MEQSGCLPHEEAKGGWNSNVKIRQHKMPPRAEGEKVREVTVTLMLQPRLMICRLLCEVYYYTNYYRVINTIIYFILKIIIG